VADSSIAALRIVDASPEDAPLVCRIMHEAFVEYRGVLDPPSAVHEETPEVVRQAIHEGGAVLAWLADVAVGSARYKPTPDGLYVGRVSVLPTYRGRGIASAMMDYMDRTALRLGFRAVRLGVRESLPSNFALYQKLGYQIVLVEQHPKGPDRTIWMVKRLKD
jgi:ribosomal protein S18 acetylase RimI-like enzyme